MAGCFIRFAIAASRITKDQRDPNLSSHENFDTSQLQATFGLTLPAWQQGVDRMLAEALQESR